MSEKKYTLETIKEELVQILEGNWKFTAKDAVIRTGIVTGRVQALHALADILLREEKPAGDPPKRRVATTGPIVITAED